MLKLVNRTRSLGSRFTFCVGPSRRCPSYSSSASPLRIFSPSFSLFFLRSCLPRKPLRPKLTAAPTMEDSHCLCGLSLPSIAKYTPASPPDHPSSPRVCFLSYASSPASIVSFRVARFPYETYGDHVRS